MPFETTKGSRTAYVVVDGVDSAECPVSRLTRNPSDFSRDLVQIFSQTEPIKELHPLGKAGNWPSSYLDAHVLMTREKSRHDQAQQVAAQKAL